MRFHPLINNYELLQAEFGIIQLGETAALDLSNEDTIWNNIQPRLKSKIRKTMKKNDASDYYFFDDALHDSLFEDLKYNVMFCYVKYEGKIISIAAILLGREILHYHLSGTDQAYHIIS
ncbi:hypothetical protein KYI11_11505 [Macrococcoides bohemicum]|uniref:Uncharacterized protein n=2 Tax=Macrococcoides bohemicum TaxID=1903056 RepID=A0AAJ4PAG9_9STAP|nr:hypothetical protein [Macrococcus bohemicus]QYA42202.1 hypothetical protein KYI11_11505 [Macrococcus bohemicus]TDL36511.1 hypothetical protein EVU91_09010 [Macrococcus bohemicus]